MIFDRSRGNLSHCLPVGIKTVSDCPLQNGMSKSSIRVFLRPARQARGRFSIEVMEDDMSNIGDGFKNIFLAGIGAMAYTGEKGKEVIDQLVAKGEITLEQGRELNDELQRKAGKATTDIRESALEARMSIMTPEEREAFVAAAARIAEEQNAKAAEVEAEVVDEETVAEAAEEVAEAAEEVAEAAEDAVEAAGEEA